MKNHSTGTSTNEAYTTGSWLNRICPTNGICDSPGIGTRVSTAGAGAPTNGLPINAVSPDPNSVTANPDTIWFARSVIDRNACTSASDIAATIATTNASTIFPVTMSTM